MSNQLLTVHHEIAATVESAAESPPMTIMEHALSKRPTNDTAGLIIGITILGRHYRVVYCWFFRKRK